MKITVEVDEEVITEFIRRSLADEKLTVAAQFRAATKFYNEIQHIVEEKKIIGIFNNEADFRRAKQYQTVQQLIIGEL